MTLYPGAFTATRSSPRPLTTPWIARSFGAAEDGGIQSHGHLICCDLRDWRVVCTSVGVASIFSDSECPVLGRVLADLLPSHAFHRWMDALNVSAHDGAGRALHGQTFADHRGHYDLTFSLSENYALVEIEERRAPLVAASETGYLAVIAARLQQLDNRVSVIKMIADEIRILTGFDRCVVQDVVQPSPPRRALGQADHGHGVGLASGRWIANIWDSAKPLVGDMQALSAWRSTMVLRCPDRAERDWLSGHGALSMLTVSLPGAGVTNRRLVALNSLASSLGGELRALVEQVGLLAGMRLHALGD